MQWFEDLSQYTEEDPLGRLGEYSSLALVRVYPDIEMTQPGWGAKTFVENQVKGKFAPERALRSFQKNQLPFATVMRSIPCVAIDIDGKNGGIETSQVLRLDRTHAEPSKSENGFHLIYSIPNTPWNPLRGYDEFPDIIGLIPGVDIKGTGVLYHYPNQRWNDHPIMSIPTSLATLIGRARDIKKNARLTRTGATALDPEELVIVHDELKVRLEGKFETGSRNNKLYALGAQMLAANYPAWDTALYDRGLEIGLELQEISDMIMNIEKYS